MSYKVWFDNTGRAHAPRKVEGSPIRIGGIEFILHEVFYDEPKDEPTKGLHSVSRNGVMIARIPSGVEPKGYFRGRARSMYPNGQGGMDVEVFIKAFMDYYKKYEPYAKFDRDFYRTEQRYLQTNLKARPS